MKRSGFTLIEVLIVISILALLAFGAILSVSKQRSKAVDAQMKSDLNRLKTAFEEYYNDHNCYPEADWFDSKDDCNSAKLAPYLAQIPCDKNTGLPYVLETDDTSCKWFKLYATFNEPYSDPQALAQWAEGGSTKGNYGVSSSDVSVSVYFDKTGMAPSPNSTLSPTSAPTSTPTPTTLPSSTPNPMPSPTPTITYYCTSNGNCTGPIPANLSCDHVWINDANCGGSCTPSICSVR